MSRHSFQAEGSAQRRTTTWPRTPCPGSLRPIRLSSGCCPCCGWSSSSTAG